VFAERVRVAVEGFPFELGDGDTTRLTCSVGFACWPFVREHPDLLTWEQVVSVADRAMYAAKYTRRNAWLGLSGTADLAHSENLVQAIQEEPQRLLADGHLQAVTSIPDDSELDWR
jgi:predicted signal transduction protein with EAL and GGDEF domain